MKKSRVLLADDHAVLRARSRALINAEPDRGEVGKAGNGQEAIELAQKLLPDVVVMDSAMPGVSGEFRRW